MSTNKESIDWYNNNASNYTDHVRNHHESVYHSLYEKPAMYSLLPDLTNKTVLSLGCGSGEDSYHMKKSGAKESVGIDISSAMIKIASQSHPDCHFMTMDMEKLTFSDETFSFAYASLSIHYIEDWTKTASEVYRVLKPGSRFLLSFNHPVNAGINESENTDKQRVEKIEIIKDKISNSYQISGDLMKRRSSSDALGKGTVTTWFKPIAEISSELTSPGFLIESIVEPVPAVKMREISLKDYQKLSKIPEFMIIMLYKPKGE